MRERSSIAPKEPVSEFTTELEPENSLPIDWWRLPDTERSNVLSEVAAFTKTLVLSYGLRESVIPACWYRHEGLVQELLALMQYRQICFSSMSPATAPKEWHVQLGFAKARLRECVTDLGCTTIQHFDSYVPAWVSDGLESWQEEFELFAREDRF